MQDICEGEGVSVCESLSNQMSWAQVGLAMWLHMHVCPLCVLSACVCACVRACVCMDADVCVSGVGLFDSRPISLSVSNIHSLIYAHIHPLGDHSVPLAQWHIYSSQSSHCIESGSM